MKWRFFFAALLFTGAYVSATENIEGTTLPVLSVEGSGYDPLSNELLITAEDIQEKGGLIQALNNEAGLDVVANGGLGQLANLSIRGGSSNSFLIIVNGSPINDASSLSGLNLNSIQPSDIKSVKVLKGNRSARYGANASSGVILIETFSERNQASYSRGSFGTSEAAVTLNQKLGAGISVGISASMLETDGISAAEPKQGHADYGKPQSELGLEQDAFKRESARAYVEHNSDRTKLNVAIFKVDSRQSFDGGAGVDKADVFVYNTDWNFWDTSYTEDTLRGGSIQASADLDAVEISLSSVLNEVTKTMYGGYGASDSYTDLTAFIPSIDLRIGVNYRSEYVEKSAAQAINKGVDTTGLYAEYERYSNDNSLRTYASVRNDTHSTFGDQLSYRAELSKKFDTGALPITIGAAGGQGFISPNLYQLYATSTWGPLGNLNLTPEKSLDAEAYLSIANKRVRATVTKFFTSKENHIQWGSGVGYYNLNKVANANGWEAQAALLIPEANAKVTVTHFSLEGEKEYTQRKVLEKQTIAGNIEAPSLSSAVSLAINHIGNRYDDLAQTVNTGNYWTVDMALTKKMDTLELQLRVDNLGDKFYQQVDGYAAMPRTITLRAIAQF